MDNKPLPVGIEEAENEVIELLALKDPSRPVVVIYGEGGIGKTTLATAVYKRLDLTAYNHCIVDTDQDSRDSDFEDMQEQIVHDLFDENLKLNNCGEGRENLSESFGKASKPVFLFIDNARRKTDLEMLLLIEHLSRLQMLIRILVTTRNLNETDIFGPEDAIHVDSHRVDPRSELAKIVDGLLQICGGGPHVMSLLNRGCNEQLEALHGGEDLCKLVVDNVCKQLSKSFAEEAFLDIAFFFYDWERNKVADIVGERELRNLEGAALVTTSEEGKVELHDIVRARGRKMWKWRVRNMREPLFRRDEEVNVVYSWWKWRVSNMRERFFRTDEEVDLVYSWLRQHPKLASLDVASRKHWEWRKCLFSSGDFVFRWWRVRTMREPLVRSDEEVDVVYSWLKQPSKEAFLDVAFFFYDWERSKVAAIVGERELEDLERAALVATSEEGKVKMRNMVRARGRQLSQGNRITDRKSLDDLLSEPQKLKQINGISLRGDGDYIKAKTVDLMSTSLRVLCLGDRTRLNGRCKRAFKQLRFLHISYEDMFSIRRLRKSSELRFLIVHLTKRNKAEFTITLPKLPQLRYLEVDVPESLPLLHLEVDASDCSSFLHINGPSLTELQLSGRFTSIPESLSTFSCLKILRFKCCSQFETLPESFENLFNLRHLDMSHCSKLERLPESFGNLSNLQHLDMSHCSKLERLPESFGNLSNLRHLDMSHCFKLERLPESFGNLSNLKHLNMSHCSKLKRLPDSFENLSNLQWLDMSHCSMLKRLPNSRNLSNLRHLDTRHCSMLDLESFGNIVGRHLEGKCAIFLPYVIDDI